MPIGLQIERFKFYFPGEYQNPRYDTTNHIIPFRHFWFKMRALPHVLAHQRVNLVRAIAHGTGYTAGADKDRLKIQMDADIAEMYGNE